MWDPTMTLCGWSACISRKTMQLEHRSLRMHWRPLLILSYQLRMQHQTQWSHHHSQEPRWTGVVSCDRAHKGRSHMIWAASKTTDICPDHSIETKWDGITKQCRAHSNVPAIVQDGIGIDRNHCGIKNTSALKVLDKKDNAKPWCQCTWREIENKKVGFNNYNVLTPVPKSSLQIGPKVLNTTCAMKKNWMDFSSEA